MEGISKAKLIRLFENTQRPIYKDVLEELLEHCEELDPWLVVDATTPKDRELVFITKEHGKVIGKWFSINQGGWWVVACMTITPTYYKELPPDPKE